MERLSRGPHQRVTCAPLFLLCLIPVRNLQSCSSPFQPFLFFIYYSPQIVLYQLLSLLHNVLELPRLPHSGPKPATFLSPAEEQQLVYLAQRSPVIEPLSQSQQIPLSVSEQSIFTASYWQEPILQVLFMGRRFPRGTVRQKAFHWLLFFSSSLRDRLPKRNVIHI